MMSTAKALPPISATLSSPILVSSLEESQGMEAMKDISPSHVPLERESERDQAPHFYVKKATKIKKLKEHLKQYRFLDRHLKQENVRLKE